MKPTKRNYTIMDELCSKLGLEPYNPYLGSPKGFYSYKGFKAPVDLTACAEDEISILKTAVSQLSEKLDDLATFN